MAWSERCSFSTLLLILTVVNTANGWSTLCFKCSSTESAPNPECSASRPIISSPQDAANSTCGGPCYTIADSTGSNVMRGCSSDYPGLTDPELLPQDGCYDWQDSLICICRMGYCNAMPMGASTGTDLYAHLPTTTAPTTKAPAPTTAKQSGGTFTCIECTSVGDQANPACPAAAPIPNFQAVSNSTCSGPCYTMTDPSGSMVVRGCSAQLFQSKPLPEDGCYDWEGSTICICRMGFCNAQAMGQSSGTELFPQETTTTATTRATVKPGTNPGPWSTLCFECTSVGDQTNPACPAVGPITDFKAVSNSTCSAPCYTMTDPSGSMVVRGCSAQLFQSKPLPEDGCYDWEGSTICICRMGFCNAQAMGQSSGTDLLPQETTTTTTTTTRAPATPGPDPGPWSTLCFDCTSLGGQNNPACPAAGPITDFRAVSNLTCSGPCYTMTDATGSMVVRGCSVQLFQSKPLPEDGCYDWEGATICICRMGFCNAQAMGKSSGKELFPQEITTRPTTTTPKPGITTPGTVEWTTRCFTCSGTGNDANSVCRAEGITDYQAVVQGTCTGPCYTMVVPAAGMVVRGCSTAMEGLPNPLPKDGCYDYTLGSTICICKMGLCNAGPIGKSSGLALDAHLGPPPSTPSPPTTTTEKFSTQCIECMSFSEGKYTDWCPGNGSVKMSIAYYGECDSPCFTRRDPIDERVVTRGCTGREGALPSPLPADGCYDWNGATYCICRDALCNKGALGKSSGVSLDAHVESIPGTFDPNGPLQCYECLSMDEDGKPVANCPTDGRVSSLTYHGNCSGACIQRNYKGAPGKIGRGCTDNQYAMPNPLPEDGCYDWMGETWCVCRENGCNGKPMGVSSGVAFDAHLDEVEEDNGIMQCYQCVNYDQKWNYYPQCPKDARVTNAFKSNCTGRCFTRSYDYDERLVARGCTTDQPGLPSPLPEDGCYTYYSSVWCLCSTPGCNRAALGKPHGVELDAHIVKDAASSVDVSKLYGFMFISLMCLIKLWLAP